MSSRSTSASTPIRTTTSSTTARPSAIIYAKVTSAPNLEAYKAALVEAQKKIAEDSVNAFLFQLPNVTVPSAKVQGLWKNAPIFVNDLSAMSGK